MGKVDREEMGQWIERMESLQLEFGDIGERMNETWQLGMVLFYEKSFAFLRELDGLLVNLRNMPTPKDGECKRAKKLFERAINARIKSLKAIAKYPSPGRFSSRIRAGLVASLVGMEGDMLRDSVKIIVSLREKYQISKED